MDISKKEHERIINDDPELKEYAKKWKKKFYDNIPNLPRTEENKIRVYEDHTGRWYEDLTEEEYIKKMDASNDAIYLTVSMEIEKEINKEIVEVINAKVRDI